MTPVPDSLLTLVQGAEEAVDIYRSSFSARSELAAELVAATDWLGANRPQVALAVLREPTMADAVVFLRVDERTWLGPLDAPGVPRWLEVPVGAEHFTEFFVDKRRRIESPPDVLPFSATPRVADGATVIDDWSRLNDTVVDEVLGVGALRWPWACFAPTRDDIANVVAEAAAAGKKISMAGKRHSQGGHTQWTDRVAGVVVVNGFGWRPSGAMFRGMLGVMGSPAMRELDAFTGWLPRASATRFGVARRWDRSTRRAYRRGMRRPQRRAFHRFMASARRHDYTGIDNAVARLSDRPVLTIFGQRNDPLRLQPKWKDRFPAATQATVAKGYHFPMCDNPELVATTIRDWHTHAVLPGTAPRARPNDSHSRPAS